MSDNVQFDSDQVGLSKNHSSSQSPFDQSQSEVQVPGMAGWLIKKGIIKNESQAKGVLLAITFINIILAACVVYFFVLK